MTTGHERAQVLSDAFQDLGFMVIISNGSRTRLLYLLEPTSLIEPASSFFGLIQISEDGDYGVFDCHRKEIRDHLKAMGISKTFNASLDLVSGYK